MKRILVPILFFLLFSSSVAAQTTIYETRTQLNGNETLFSEIAVVAGELSVNASTTQGDLNLTIVQENATLLTTTFNRLDGEIMETITVEAGTIQIRATSSGNFFPSAVDILVVQDTSITTNPSTGIFIGTGVILVLLLPFAYVYGRSKGQAQ